MNISQSHQHELLLEAVKDFKSLDEYNSKLKKYKPTKGVEIMGAYSYLYDYSTDYDFEKLKYFDFFPLTILFSENGKGNVWGLNFHHLPLLTRSWLLSRLKSGQPHNFKNKSNFKLNITYLTLKSILKKAPLAVRQYRIDRMHDVRKIPNVDLQELVKYQPPTFHAVEFPAVVKKYSSTKI